ncbi:MAG: TonB-dependent receptor [Saprospiraceae bacterium]
MKRNLLLFFLCFFCVLTISAQTNLTTKIDFVAENLSVPSALDKLAKEQKINIAFSKHFFKRSKPVTVDYKYKELDLVLKGILGSAKVSYKFQNNQLIIYRKKKTAIAPNNRTTFSGFVSEASSGERLVGVNVYDRNSQKWATTNEYGFYSITLPANTNRLNFSYLGCEPHEVALENSVNKRLDVSLNSASTLAEVIVRPDVDSSGLTSLIDDGQLMPPNYVSIAPGIGGEADIINMVTTLPGVQTGADGFGGLYVRGGEAGQNLMLLDGVPIYNPGHLLGVFSVYNTDAIRSARLLKGSFPARYGGRASSVFDVRTKEGNQKKWTAEIGSGLISAKAKVEGPLFNKKGGFLFTARRSHSPFLLENVFRTGIFQNSTANLEGYTGDASFSSNYNYNFFDINAKLHFPIGKKDKLFFSFYQGQDHYRQDAELLAQLVVDPSYPDELVNSVEQNETILKWGNQTSAIRWNRIWGAKLFSNITATYSNYNFQDSRFNTIGLSEFFLTDLRLFSDLRSRIRDFSLKSDFDYSPNNKHRIRFGSVLTHHELSPFSITQEFDEPLVAGEDIEDIEGLVDSYEEVSVGSIEGALYVEDEFKLTDQLLFNGGFRFSYFTGNENHFFNVEPRLGISYQPFPKWSFTGGLSKMTQYLHQIPSSGLSLPNDIWVPSTEFEKPLISWIYEIGITRKIGKNINLSVEGFYKKMDGILAPNKPSINSNIVVNPDFSLEGVSSGSGTSKGIEFLFQKEGKTGGWISYTLSKSDRSFDNPDFNSGETFDFRFDQKHNINIFGYHQFNKKWHFSFNWKNNSAAPEIRLDPLTTAFAALDLDVGEQSFNIRTQERGRVYHRLDINFNYQTQWGKTKHTFKVGAFNVYNRSNAAFYSVFYTDFSGIPELTKIPVTLMKFTPSLYYSIGF